MILFHGGCHGCTQQEINGINFCYDCRYFDGKWSKPNLDNSPKTLTERIRREVKERRKV